MKTSCLYIILVLFTFIASRTYGQWEEESSIVDSGWLVVSYISPVYRLTNDRPKPKLHLIRPLSIPQQVNSISNMAPDFPNFDVSNYYLADQNETSIAINPVDPNNIIIGANDYRSFSALYHFESTDGGITWKDGELQANWGSAAYATDPALGFNSSGEVFYTYGRGISHDNPVNDIVCHTSIDSGKNWSLPVRILLDSNTMFTAATTADKYYLAVDKYPGSQFPGRIYVSWVEYDSLHRDRVRISHSTDNGKSWSVPVYITGEGDYQSPIPAIGNGGELYVVYENINPVVREIRIAISDDGGKTFGFNEKIANYTELGPYYPPSDPFGHPIIKGGLRVNSFPTIAVDNSNAHHKRIYIAWAGMGADLRAHIYLTLSDDLGSTWSAPKAIENDPSPVATDKFFPWIAVDDVTGDVGIACYDSRADTTNVLTDLFMFFSGDGGQTFTQERISGQSFDVRANSSLDTSGNDGPKYFFGDYIGIAAHNKMWYPAWTDSRVGYDQDIYDAIVRPYAPSAPRNFIAVEDSTTHLPDLSWQYSSVTTFGASLGEYVFRLSRSDGKLQVDLPKTARSYIDSSVVKKLSYTYVLQIISSNQDTSASVEADFNPYASRQSQAPVIASAQAQSAGSSVTFYFVVPDKNIAGTTIHNLHQIYFIVDGAVTDSFTITDSSRGKQFDRYFSFAADGYHKFQLAAGTLNSENDTTLSPFSQPSWLYAGTPLTSYTENFSGTKNIFTPFAWDTTRANGELPAEFINDSLPDVPYQKDLNSWFLLPPVAITDNTKTIEYADIALVASGDSAIVETSIDDGVTFSPISAYDKSHSVEWTNTLLTSKPVHEILSLKYLIGKNVITRFRLRTHSSGGDGWFIDSIRFTPLLSVPSQNPSATFSAQLISDPVRAGATATIKIYSDKPVAITMNIYSMLGKNEGQIISNRQISGGEYGLEFSPLQAGCYFYEVIAHSEENEKRCYGKFIVIP
jgi:hypothetical protein